MEQKTKERLVGSLVLLCLAIIFIPPFYDGRNPFDLDEKPLNRSVNLAPNFHDAEAMAEEIANVGDGRINEIEQKVKGSLQQEAINDSQLQEQESSLIEDFNASEMTTRLLSELAESSALASRFSKQNDLKQAWAVQVGSFEEANRAQKLRDELLSAGFHAYIKTFKKDGKSVSRVFAGVSLDKGVAEDIKNKLEGQFEGLSSIIVPYQ